MSWRSSAAADRGRQTAAAGVDRVERGSEIVDPRVNVRHAAFMTTDEAAHLVVELLDDGGRVVAARRHDAVVEKGARDAGEDIAANGAGS